MNVSPPSKKRNASTTKEAILVAARRVFTDSGYDGAGLREIAALAGVNVALINRYFGSKDGLFKAAIVDHLDLEQIFAGDMADFGNRMSDYFLSHPVKKEGYDPTLAILRSTSSETSVKVIAEALETGFCDLLQAKLPDLDPDICATKAGLLTAMLMGFDMMRRVFQLRALDANEHTHKLLANSLQAIINA
ncbi:TetR family transcriptional regulator [Falsihalocynthiibacter sp. SS001]|uniref:TetR/AcrR family transcriptional regulator n=1 Tax=Falsihalocynthiibacter sp. SS001 TaxID=3349698 RepID=UPI0036D2DED6